MRLDPGLAALFLAPKDITKATRQRADTLAQEAASGRIADVGRALRGDFSDVSRLSYKLETLDAEATSLGQAKRWGDGLQKALERLGTAAGTIGGNLDTALNASKTFLSDQAKAAVRDMAGILNTTIGQRSLFGNGGQDGAIPDIDAVITDVEALAVASPTYEDYAAAVDTYFSAGGAFETTRLAPMPADPIDFPGRDGGRIAIEVSVASREVVDVIAQVALVAGMDAGGFPVRPNSDASLDLAARFSESQGNLPLLRGRLGAVEARVDALLTQADTERSDTEMAIADRVGTDPFETASKLQNELARLESLFAITARKSQLSLTRFLR